MKKAIISAFAGLFAIYAWADDRIVIDAEAPHHAFPHFWEQMFGSGRAILTLRESYRQDLRAVKKATDFQFVRFHAIFHDEVGLYDEDARGNPSYNFSYIDEIYDGLLANGVRPFIELSFMPRKLASREVEQNFRYHPIVAPPRDYAKWDALIAAFASHLIERYGIEEVAHWYFEVWNEPNIDFWVGIPAQATYWTLYDHTAKALRQVNSRLRIGGPATAQAAWVGAFIRHCTENDVPFDFVSTHVYANDTPENVFGRHEKITRSEMVCRAAKKVHDEVAISPRPGVPIVWSEYNATYFNDPEITDAAFMGPWLADTLRRCDGLTEMMSYWTLSDVFEEQGVVKRPFYGGYGLIAAGGIPKPAFNAFKMLHALGNERIDVDSEHALVTRRSDGSLVIAVWNYADPGIGGTPSTSVLLLKHVTASSARLLRLDADHGDVGGEHLRLGSPSYPTRAQRAHLMKAAQLAPAEVVAIHNHRLSLTLPPHGLAILELAADIRTVPAKGQ